MQNSPARPGIDVGSVIDDTYTIEALIGRGGMGAVFLASHKRLAGKKVAIKVLHTDVGNEETLARFKREADIASSLDHPNIVKIENYDLMPDGAPYIVLEYLDGRSLAQRIAEGPLPLDEALSITRQVGSALAAAHRAGIVHRDLKPQNIFLVPSEVDGKAIQVAKVLDFGISKMLGSQTVKTQENSMLGTPQYMAPEQATGQHSMVDERTDIFALGAIVYEMLTGHPAFAGASIPEVVFKVVYEQPKPLAQEVPNLPPPIAAAVTRAMAKSAGDRFATVSAFIEALTGHALSVRHRPASAAGLGGPPDSVKRTGNVGESGDAFAKTMGSGDHGESPVVAANAATVDSIAAPSPAPSAVTTEPVAPTSARRPAVPLVLGVGGAVALAFGLYVVLRAPRGVPAGPRVTSVESSPSAGPTSAAPPTAAAPTPTPAPTPAPTIAGMPAPTRISAPSPTVPVVTSRANPDATKPIEKAGKRTDVPVPQRGDPEVQQRLVEAEAAIRSKAYQHAEELANAVILSDTGSAAQKEHAHAIHGIVQCAFHNSEERTDLRQIERPAWRKELLDACHAENKLESELH